MELAHSRESERKSNDALIKCLALEARFALSAPPPHSPMGQESPKLSVAAEEEPTLLSVKSEKSQAGKGKRHNKSQGPRDSGHPSSDSDAASDGTVFPGGQFSRSLACLTGATGDHPVPLRVPEVGIQPFVRLGQHVLTVRRYDIQEA
jgi:hypothetical protein